MALRELLLPWLQQPQEACGVSEEWLAKGLVYADTTLARNAIGGAAATARGTKLVPLSDSQARGFGATLGVATTDSVRTGFFGDSVLRTYVIRFTRNGSGGNNLGRLLSKFTSGTECELLYVDSSANRLAFERRWTTGVLQIGFPNLTNGESGLLILSYDGSSSSNDPVLWKNGTALTGARFGATPSGAVAANTQELIIGNRISDNARVWDGLLSDVLVFDSILSDDDKAALTINTNIVYQPQSIWVPVSAPAGASHDATGALAADASTIAGSAARKGQHSASGALTAQDAAVAGTANRLIAHAASGALAADAATLAGVSARTRVHAATGDLAAGAAEAAGTAARADPIPGHVGAGSLVSGSATATGTAVRTHLHSGSGALSADAAALAGAAAHTKSHASTGALAAGAAAVAGEAYIGTEPPPATRNAGFEVVSGRRVVPEVRRKPLLQQVLEAKAERLMPAPKAVKKRVRAIEVQAAKAVLDDKPRETFRELMQQWSVLRPVPAAVPASEAFMAEVRAQVLAIQRRQDEEDDEDVLLLLA